jgi:HD superfamily phosphodiesterase
MQQILYDFVEQYTINFDKSHDIHHAIKVFNNATKIINSMEIDYERDVITWASMLHDICDHKYHNCVSKDELFEFIKMNLGEIKASRIIMIIDNVSYSKEVRGERVTLPYPDYLYLDIISDADRVEALGYSGIERCEEYTIAKLGINSENSNNLHIIKKEVIKHCHEKLLKLFPDYFKTPLGKELAFPLHLEIVDYVKNNS